MVNVNLSSLRVSSAIALATLGSGLVAQARVELTEDRVPGQFYRPDWLCFRVLDDLTGAPVEGAEVFFLRESKTPMAGDFWYLAKATSDEDGLIDVPVGKIGDIHEQIVKHPDYGVCSRSGGEYENWRLGRPFDVPILVRDWQKRPAKGAFIGYCGGCGHTPDLVNATTGEDGIAILRGVDPYNHIRDVYVQRAGLGLGYHGIDWRPGDPPVIVDCEWSYAMTGKVVDHLGEPVAGAHVAALDVHRGPWARTALDGTFTLLGADPDIGASHVRTRFGHGVWFSTPDRAVYPITLRLPDPRGDDPHEGTVEGADGKPPAVLPLPELRLVRVAFAEDVDPTKVSAFATAPGFDERFDVEDGNVEVPATGPFALTCRPLHEDGWAGQRTFAFADVQELLNGAFELRPWPPTRVTGRIVDGSGASIAAQVRWVRGWGRGDDDEGEAFTQCPDGRFEFTATRTGKAMLEIAPATPGLVHRQVFVTLPLRGDDRVVALGDLALDTAPQLVISDAAGPCKRAKVRWARAGFQGPDRWMKFELGEEGDWRGPDLMAGDVVELRGDDAGNQAVRFPIEGDGPWRFTVPTGRLTIAVTDADGDEIGAEVTYADRTVDVPDGPMRRLPLGPLELWVTSQDRGTAYISTVITAEPQRIGIVMPTK